jgi:hypothetical protein
MRLLLVFALASFSNVALAQEHREMAPFDRTWMYLNILDSESGTDATARLRESGISANGARRLLVFLEAEIRKPNDLSLQYLLRICAMAADPDASENVAREIDLWRSAERALQQSIVDRLPDVLGADDLTKLHESAQMLRGSLTDFDTAIHLRSGRIASKPIIDRACQGAESLLARYRYEREEL